MTTALDLLANVLGATARGWRGTMVSRVAEQPAEPLKLYDIESCPYCRLVRETLTELDLDVLILPCPKNGQRYRVEAERIGGKQQFPLLVDDNTGTTMYESADIMAYLWRTYGGSERSPSALRHAIAVAGSNLATLAMLRPGGIAGLRLRPSTAPAERLELYSFETSPFSKPVRARLCELELPYLLRNTGKGQWSDMGPPMFRDRVFKGHRDTTRNRAWLAENTGRVQVPYLIDPNTGVAMYESRDILAYLNRTYAQPVP